MPRPFRVGSYNGSLELQAKLDEEYKRLVEDCHLLRHSVFSQQDSSSPHYLPTNLHGIVENAQRIFHIDARKPSDFDPTYIITIVTTTSERLTFVRSDDPLSLEAQRNATIAFRMYLWAIVSTRRTLERRHLNREAFNWVLGETETKFNQSVAHPVEMYGTLATQPIGEAATQTTLNTFHHTGTLSKNEILGVPRLEEIINVATNIKTPSLSVYLQPEITNDRILAKNVQQELVYTALRTVVAAIEIWYGSNHITISVGSFFAISDKLPLPLPPDYHGSFAASLTAQISSIATMQWPMGPKPIHRSRSFAVGGMEIPCTMGGRDVGHTASIGSIG